MPLSLRLGALLATDLPNLKLGYLQVSDLCSRLRFSCYCRGQDVYQYRHPLHADGMASLQEASRLASLIQINPCVVHHDLRSLHAPYHFRCAADNYEFGSMVVLHN